MSKPKIIPYYKCSNCLTVLRSAEGLKFHIKKRHEGNPRPYQCSICPKNYTKYSHLKEHRLVAHIDSKPFRCTLCNNLYKTFKCLKSHSIKVHGALCREDSVKFLKCIETSCAELFYTNESRDSHFEEKHVSNGTNKDGRYECDQCLKTYKHRSHLTVHRKSHISQKPLQCEHCDRTFLVEKNLKLHLQRHADRSKFLKTVKCSEPTCSKFFESEEIRDGHFKSKHEGIERPYQCSVCSKSYKTRSDLLQHLNSHSSDPLKCPQCETTFLYRKNLEVHLKRHEIQSKLFKCSDPSCKKLFDTEEDLDAHFKDKHEGVVRPHQCSLCPKRYKTPGLLGEHINTVHSSSKTFKCDKCEKAFASQKQLNSHYKIHSYSNSKAFQCNKCDKAFAVRKSLNSHYKVHGICSSPNSKTFQCQQCEKSFGFQNNLDAHMNAHSELGEAGGVPAYPCGNCSETYETETALEDHRYNVHTEDRRFKCETCNISFRKAHGLTSHNNRKHSTFVCNICDKSFSYRSRFEEHQRVHTGERPFVCDFPDCGLTFTSAQYLKYHKTKHENPITCESCDKVFSCPINLRKHVSMYHRKEYKFRCEICNQGMYNKSKLKRHMLAHAGERQFMCEVCGSSFYDQSYLNVHMKRHMKTTNFKCKVCEKGFYDSSALARHHAGVHSRAPLHVCEVCGKGFPVRNYLYVHMRMHNKNSEGTWGWGYKKPE